MAPPKGHSQVPPTVPLGVEGAKIWFSSWENAKALIFKECKVPVIEGSAELFKVARSWALRFQIGKLELTPKRTGGGTW